MKKTKTNHAAINAPGPTASSAVSYAALITLGLLALAWGATSLDRTSVGDSLINHVPFLRVDNADTARALLASLLKGLLASTLPMVAVVVLVLAAGSVPGEPGVASKGISLIAPGTVTGTTGFLIVVLDNLGTRPPHEVPVLSVALGTLLAFASLAAVLFFTYQTLQEALTQNRLSSLYRTTRHLLDKELSSGSYEEIQEEDGQWLVVKAWASGYFDTVTEGKIKEASEKRGLKLRVLRSQGAHLLKGAPFLKVNQPVDKELQKLLEESVTLRHQEVEKESCFDAFSQITAVAVRALSPERQDLGTALRAIDYLTDLLCRLQQLGGQKVVRRKDGVACLAYAPVPFERLFRLCIATIRACSTQDVAVQVRLIDLITKTGLRDACGKHSALLKEELNAIEAAAVQHLKSHQDVAHIKALVEEARKQI